MHEQVEPAPMVLSLDGNLAGDSSLVDSTAATSDLPDVGISTDDEIAPPLDIGRRFTNWRTLISFLIALAILVVALRKSGVTINDVESALRKVNPLLYACAFIVYYVSFPIRTLRWKLLMLNANTGHDYEKIKRTKLKDLLEILYLSWFANCVIPAKLGDVYRAYLTRTSVGISGSRTMGTILAERILDLLILFPLLLSAAILTFHNKLLADSALRYVLGGALGLGVIAIVVVLAIWRLGDGLRAMLPLRIHSVFSAFREGAIHSFRGNIGALLGLSILIWVCEGGRLFLVLAALGMIKQGEIGPSAALFLALGSSVLTTLPISPGGLGFVDAFLIATFRILKQGSTGGQAAALALLDRIVSYLSIVIIGFVLYLVSAKTKAALPAIRDQRHAGPGDSGHGDQTSKVVWPEQTSSVS